MQEFGRIAFPRGRYLQGHLEADREPGHFVGKGSLSVEFYRIGLPNTDVPMPSKVVNPSAYRVDRDGDIIGKGHAKRDAVERGSPFLALEGDSFTSTGSAARTKR